MSTNKNSYSNCNKDKTKFKDLVQWDEYFQYLDHLKLLSEVKRIKEIQDRKLVDKYFRDYDNSEVINNGG